MATVITHALGAAALGRAVFKDRLPWRVCEIAAIVSILPDIDVLAFAFGIPYEHPMGHRGFTHSLLFAAASGWTAAWLAVRSDPELKKIRRRLTVFFILAAASHGVLDALTNGGLGIAFFAPLNNARFFFPWTPLEVSPIGGAFFGERGMRVLLNEALWIWIPTALLCAALRFYHSRRY